MNLFNWFTIGYGLLLFVVLQQLSQIYKRVSNLNRVEAKLDLLLKSAAIEYDPYKNLSIEVTQALQRGDKIAAIKAYRESTGAGLEEAKDFIEGLQNRPSADS